MHIVKLIFITAAYMHNNARASGVCGKPEMGDNTVPVSKLSYNIGEGIRIQCADGYVRKAGTSNLIRCSQQTNGTTSWHSELPLKCIPDPKKPHVATSVCGKPEMGDNTVPVSKLSYNIGEGIRIQCADGYVRKAGTSNLIRCSQQTNGTTSWHSELPLKCIPDPKKPHLATTETQRFHNQWTSSNTERTARKHPTIHDTSSPNTATGYITLTTTNEVVATKSRRTTSQPTLMSTTKETESITTTNETTTSYTSKEYKTTTSSHMLSGSFTTTTGVNASVRTSTISEGRNTDALFSHGYAATIGGVIGIILLCLVAAVFILLWFRPRNHRNQTVYHPKPDPSASYIPLPLCASEHGSAQSNKSAENSTEVSVTDKNPGIPYGDKLLPQTDS